MSSSALQKTSHTDANYLHSALTDSIIKAFYAVYNELGNGFLETVYQQAMVLVLRANGHRTDREVALPVHFRGERIAEFKADLVVEGSVIVKLKVARVLDRNHEAQLLNYLKATHVEVGLLLNFGEQPQVRRLILTDDRKNQRSSAKISG